MRSDCRVAEKRHGVVKGKAACMLGEKLVEERLELGVDGVDEFVLYEFIDQFLSRNWVSICGDGVVGSMWDNVVRSKCSA